jgi:hypothetical protein
MFRVLNGWGRVMTAPRTTSPRRFGFALLFVSMAAICVIGVIAALSTLIPRSPSPGGRVEVAPVELDRGQGAGSGHEGVEPDRRDGQRPQDNAFAEPAEQASESQWQAAGSTAEPAPAPAVVVAAPAPPSDDQSSGEGAGSPAAPAPAPDPAGEATAAPPATSSRDDDAAGDRDNARGDDNQES